MKKLQISDEALCAAVMEMEAGLIDADLGGNVLKKRVRLPGHGKRGGARTIVATKRAGRWFFVYGFAKNVRANISSQELEALRLLAGDLLSLNMRQLDALLKAGALKEICNDKSK